MSVDADVLVVGGGPVGLASAIEARLAGLTVVVIEPREGPIDKACGEGLMPGALPLLHRLGVDPAGRILRGVSYRSGSSHADHEFRSGVGRGVRRTVLHRALAARADALGAGRIVARVTDVVDEPGGVAAGGVTGQWLLACDGLHSMARRAVGLQGAPARRARYGIREHVAVAPWSDLIEVHWTPLAEIYVTPVDDTTVGVATLGPRGVGLDDALAFAPALARRLEGAPRVSERRGAGPFGERARRPSSGRVLLVGDASGYVDALTGEGLRVGFEQARVAVASLVGGVPYDAEWRRVTRTFRRLTRGLVAVAESPVRGAIVPVASALPGLYGSIVERLAR